MDQFSLYVIEHHGASALAGSAAHGMPGTRGYEKWAREVRILRNAHEQSAAARLERRRRRLQRRLDVLTKRINGGSRGTVSAAGW
ncbi:hypothetical protein [Paramicrobacterium fandaimingii]|uniref:hypothetical protein n=1 Tax=Paramicrobacterium fandaimingii TaxID=2708079 RepID=UPI001422BBC9|nr:hypothetical protein [Microbacterium fandaimingii]